jgi:hypothetical protein
LVVIKLTLFYILIQIKIKLELITATKKMKFNGYFYSQTFRSFYYYFSEYGIPSFSVTYFEPVVHLLLFNSTFGT